ncbi:MAG: hypothetical protein GY737_00390 [Desulfobacteraceae bacterium]|nr:hypothetical protein [Desulfobacteraceae bacterium]
MMPQQVTAIRDLFEDPDIGLWHFAREVFQFRDLKWELHGPICQLLGHWGETHLADGTILTPEEQPGDRDIAQSYRRLMIRIPRECFKTSLATRANGLLTVSKNPERTVGVFNETEKKPMQWIGAVCNVIEGSILYQMVYRDILPKGIGFWDKDKGVPRPRNLKWGSTGFQLLRNSLGVAELTMEPYGIGGAQAGMHYTHKILDDIIGKEASKSPAVMQTARDWIDVSRPLERPAEHGCELICHTKWGYHDVYKYIEEEWPGEYLIHSRSLLENSKTGEPDDVHGKSIFPEKITTRKAYQMQNTPGKAYTFASQYQNKPKAGKGQSFDEEWFGYVTIEFFDSEPFVKFLHTGAQGHELPTFNSSVFDKDCGEEFAPSEVPLYLCSKTLIIDPAPGKQNEINRDPKARNGLAAVAIDPWGRKICLESRDKRCGPTQLMEEAVKLARKWYTSNIAIEEVVFSAVYAPLWNRIMELDDNYRDFTPNWLACYPKGRDKTERMRDNLIPDHENGLWYYMCKEPGEVGGPTGLVRKELKEFPFSETVDLMDAQSYTREVLSRPNTPEEAWLFNEAKRRSEADRGVTGYGW